MGSKQLISSLKRGRQEISLSSQFIAYYASILKISLIISVCSFQEIFSKLNYGIEYRCSVFPFGTYMILDSLFRSGQNLKYFYRSCISYVTSL